ncbi:MAG: PAC2 family protein [Candidatus Bathyarchaeota archaeon]
MKAEQFGEIHSRFFPPYVIVEKGGIVELLRNELHCWRNGENNTDLMFLTGNSQTASPEGQYMIAEEVLSTAIKFGVRRLYSIEAYLTDRHIDRSRVYGVVTDPVLMDWLKEYGVLPLEEGSIGGVSGLLLGLAKTEKIQGVCLLGETRGYQTTTGHTIVDAEAARAVLEALTKMLGIKVDMAPLEDQAKTTAELIGRMEAVERRVIEQMYRTSPPGHYIT